MDLLGQLKVLRDEAWSHVTKTKEYQAYIIVERAYTEMTSDQQIDATRAGGIGNAGPRAGGIGSVVSRAGVRGTAPRAMYIGGAVRRRATQAVFAARVLMEGQRPMPIADLLEACIADGMIISGEDPLSNFRSTMSRDPRFTNFQHGGTYFWWLADQPLPDKWRAEAGMLDLQTASARQADEEGGGGDDADNTDLAS